MSNKIKNCIIIIILILLPIIDMKSTFSQEKKHFSDCINEWYNSQPDFFKITYKNFVTKIGKEDIFLEGWSRIRTANDKLIIGSSGVIWCSVILGDQMDILGYDSVAFGGVPDEYMRDWVKRIKKRYKKVIVFSGTNTIDLCTHYNYDCIDGEVYSSIVDTLMAVSKNLLTKDGLLCYVKIKERTGDDIFKYGIEKVMKYNKLASELNYLLDQMESVEKLTLNYPTDKRYSEEYVHYNKKEVWEDLLTQ